MECDLLIGVSVQLCATVQPVCQCRNELCYKPVQNTVLYTVNSGALYVGYVERSDTLIQYSTVGGCSNVVQYGRMQYVGAVIWYNTVQCSMWVQ